MTARLQTVLLRVGAVLALIYLIAPLAVVIPVSLTDQRMLSLPVEGISFRHYETVLHSRDWLESAGQSVVIGIASTVLAMTIGILSAIGCWMLGQGRSVLFRIVNLLPIVIPSIIFALGAYRFFVDIGLVDTLPGVVLVHTVGSIPFVCSLGAGLLRTTWEVVLPNIKTGLVSAAIFAFLHSWDEVVVTLFVSSRAVHTLPRRMWEGLNENLDPAIACIAVALIALTLVLLLVEQRANRPDASPPG